MNRRLLARDALILAPVMILVAGALACPATVMSEVLDALGDPILDKFGEVVLEEDRWETWKLNWESNLMMGFACGLLLFGLVSYGWDWGRRVFGKPSEAGRGRGGC